MSFCDMQFNVYALTERNSTLFLLLTLTVCIKKTLVFSSRYGIWWENVTPWVENGVGDTNRGPRTILTVTPN